MQKPLQKEGSDLELREKKKGAEAHDEAGKKGAHIQREKCRNLFFKQRVGPSEYGSCCLTEKCFRTKPQNLVDH